MLELIQLAAFALVLFVFGRGVYKFGSAMSHGFLSHQHLAAGARSIVEFAAAIVFLVFLYSVGDSESEGTNPSATTQDSTE